MVVSFSGRKIQMIISGVKSWYIGLSDLGIQNVSLKHIPYETILSSGKEGNWNWIHSDEDITESIWDTNRPNNSIRNSDDCVFMKMKRNKAVWMDSRHWSYLTSLLSKVHFSVVSQRDL